MSRPTPYVDSLIQTSSSKPNGNTFTGATVTVSVVKHTPVIAADNNNNGESNDDGNDNDPDTNNRGDDQEKKQQSEEAKVNKKKSKSADKVMYALFVTEDEFRSPSLQTQYSSIDWSIVHQLAKVNGFRGASGSLLVVNKVGLPVLILGLPNQPTLSSLRSASQSISKKAISAKFSHIIVHVPSHPNIAELAPVKLGFGRGVKGTPKSNVSQRIITPTQLIDVMIRGLLYSNWSHDLYLEKKKFRIGEITLVSTADIDMNAVMVAVNGAESVSLAREIGSLRFQDANNTYMKELLVKLVATHSDVLQIKVLDRQQCLAEGYNLIAAVNQASWDQCYLVAVEYTPPGYVERQGDAPIGMLAFYASFLISSPSHFELH